MKILEVFSNEHIKDKQFVGFCQGACGDEKIMGVTLFGDGSIVASIEFFRG